MRTHRSRNNVLRGFLCFCAWLSPLTVANAQREGIVDVKPAARLFYHIEGTSGDTLIVVHGGPAFGHGYMAADLAQLSRRHVVIHYDQRGAGRSTLDTVPAHLSIEQHVEDLEQLRRALAIDKITILGHSWGGMLAARYAIAHPAAVRRVLLIEPMAPARELLASRPPRDTATARRMRTLFPAMSTADDPIAACREFFSPGVAYRVYFSDSTAIARLRGDFCARPAEAIRLQGKIISATVGSLGAFDVRPLLSSIMVPVLILHGSESGITRDAMLAWLKSLPDARLVALDGAGHYPWVDRPEAFFKSVETFLNGSWPREATP